VDLAERVAALPTSSGVYLMKSAQGKVLYVGKAQNLRSRVRSYFRAGGDGRVQVPKLVRRVADIAVLVTPTVKDALLLENELIKQHKPPFNVRLRDDKQYLGLRLDPREEWPRLTPVRRFKRDGAQYFGPYTSSSSMHATLRDLRRIFPLRSCSDGVFSDYRRRGRPCIEYEMGRCSGPCVGRVAAESYRALVAGTQLFLRGRASELLRTLRTQMEVASKGEHFEEAARQRDRIQAIEDTLERQQIVSERPVDRDVFGWARDGGEVAVQVLHVREGRVVGSAEYAFREVGVEDAEVMGSFLGQYYAGDAERQVPAEVLTALALEDGGAVEALLHERAGRKVALRTPLRGTSRELVAMASRNAEVGLQHRLSAQASIQAAQRDLQQLLHLDRLPRRIECYDISNLQGTLAVGSRVVFEEGQASKADYRRYKIRQAAAGDDLACMREVLARRLARRAKEPLPDLWLLDGGRGQLGVATVLLRDAGVSLDHIGLAKERDEASPSARVKRGGGLKAERIFLPNRVNPLSPAPGSRALLLLQQVRDEAHRFAIEFQRTLRRKQGLTSILEEIPGIGSRKRRSLLRELGSLRRVRESSPEELARVAGISAGDAQAVHAFFRALAAEREDEFPS